MSEKGDILVIDDGGRTDQACVGDLVTLEMATGGLSGIIIWGLHRDTPELQEIGLPVFSLGTIPAGPLGLAENIRETERGQADEMRSGRSFREQVAFKDYLGKKAQNPEFTFREHLRQMGKALEE